MAASSRLSRPCVCGRRGQSEAGPGLPGDPPRGHCPPETKRPPVPARRPGLINQLGGHSGGRAPRPPGTAGRGDGGDPPALLFVASLCPAAEQRLRLWAESGRPPPRPRCKTPAGQGPFVRPCHPDSTSLCPPQRKPCSGEARLPPTGRPGDGWRSPRSRPLGAAGGGGFVRAVFFVHYRSLSCFVPERSSRAGRKEQDAGSGVPRAT